MTRYFGIPVVEADTPEGIVAFVNADGDVIGVLATGGDAPEGPPMITLTYEEGPFTPPRPPELALALGNPVKP